MLEKECGGNMGEIRYWIDGSDMGWDRNVRNQRLTSGLMNQANMTSNTRTVHNATQDDGDVVGGYTITASFGSL